MDNDSNTLYKAMLEIDEIFHNIPDEMGVYRWEKIKKKCLTSIWNDLPLIKVKFHPDDFNKRTHFRNGVIIEGGLDKDNVTIQFYPLDGETWEDAQFGYEKREGQKSKNFWIECNGEVAISITTLKTK